MIIKGTTNNHSADNQISVAPKITQLCPTSAQPRHQGPSIYEKYMTTAAEITGMTILTWSEICLIRQVPRGPVWGPAINIRDQTHRYAPSARKMNRLIRLTLKVYMNIISAQVDYVTMSRFKQTNRGSVLTQLPLSCDSHDYQT